MLKNYFLLPCQPSVAPKLSLKSKIQQLEQQLEQKKERYSSQVKETIKEIELESIKGIYYSKLRDILAQQQWKEAAQETSEVMLQAANREEERWFRDKDIGRW